MKIKEWARGASFSFCAAWRDRKPPPAGRNRDRLGTGRDRAVSVGRSRWNETANWRKIVIETENQMGIENRIECWDFADLDSAGFDLDPVAVATTYFDLDYWVSRFLASGQHPAVELQQSVSDRHR